MKSIEFLKKSQPEFGYYLNFIIFEPASQRIHENDILCRGNEISKILNTLIETTPTNNDLKNKALLNRLNRIKMMLELVKNPEQIIVTKFLNKVWRRYSFFSNLKICIIPIISIL